MSIVALAAINTLLFLAHRARFAPHRALPFSPSLFPSLLILFFSLPAPSSFLFRHVFVRSFFLSSLLSIWLSRSPSFTLDSMTFDPCRIAQHATRERVRGLTAESPGSNWP